MNIQRVSQQQKHELSMLRIEADSYQRRNESLSKAVLSLKQQQPRGAAPPSKSTSTKKRTRDTGISSERNTNLEQQQQRKIANLEYDNQCLRKQSTAQQSELDECKKQNIVFRSENHVLTHQQQMGQHNANPSHDTASDHDPLSEDKKVLLYSIKAKICRSSQLFDSMKYRSVLTDGMKESVRQILLNLDSVCKCIESGFYTPLSEEVVALRAKVQKFKQNAACLRTKNQAMARKTAELTEEVTTLSAEKSTLSKRSESMAAEIAKLRASRNTVNAKQSVAVQHYKEEAVETKNALCECEEAKRLLMNKLQQTTSNAELLDKEVRRLSQEYKAKVAILEQIATHLNVDKLDGSWLEDIIARCEEVQSAKVAMQKQLDEADQDRDALRLRLYELEELREEQVSAVLQRAEAMEGREAMLQSVTQIQADYAKLQNEYDALATENDAALVKTQAREADLVAAQQMATHCEGLTERIEKLKRDADLIIDENVDLQSQLSHAQKENEILKRNLDETDWMRMDNQRMKNAAADQSDHQTALAANLERVENEKQALIRQTATLQRDYDELMAAHVQVDDDTLQQELTSARETAQQLTDTVSCLQRAQQEQVADADEKLNTLCSENEQLERQLGCAHARAVELESANERLHCTVEQMLQSKCKVNVGELESSKSEVASLRKKLDVLTRSELARTQARDRTQAAQQMGLRRMHQAVVNTRHSLAQMHRAVNFEPMLALLSEFSTSWDKLQKMQTLEAKVAAIPLPKSMLHEPIIVEDVAIRTVTQIPRKLKTHMLKTYIEINQQDACGTSTDRETAPLTEDSSWDSMRQRLNAIQSVNDVQRRNAEKIKTQKDPAPAPSAGRVKQQPAKRPEPTAAEMSRDVIYRYNSAELMQWIKAQQRQRPLFGAVCRYMNCIRSKRIDGKQFLSLTPFSMEYLGVAAADIPSFMRCVTNINYGLEFNDAAPVEVESPTETDTMSISEDDDQVQAMRVSVSDRIKRFKQSQKKAAGTTKTKTQTRTPSPPAKKTVQWRKERARSARKQPYAPESKKQRYNY